MINYSRFKLKIDIINYSRFKFKIDIINYSRFKFKIDIINYSTFKFKIDIINYSGFKFEIDTKNFTKSQCRTTYYFIKNEPLVYLQNNGVENGNIDQKQDNEHPFLTFTSSKSSIEALEKRAKYVQKINIENTRTTPLMLFRCFHC